MSNVDRRVRIVPWLVALVLAVSTAGLVNPGTSWATTLTPLSAASFADNAVAAGQWVLPTASGGNKACLTAGPTSGSTSIPDCSPTTDSSGSGALRLTSNGAGQVGSVFNTTSLPTSQGLDIIFNTYQFNGTGGDGMSLTLAATDPSNPRPPSAAGPSGGTLGYSTNGSQAGIPDGYLGIGLDVYGNYLSRADGGSACPSLGSIASSTYPQSVTVRGPGVGTTGYCVVATTANTSSPSGVNNLPGGTGTLDNKLATSRDSGDLVPVEVAINPSGSANTTTSGFVVPADSFSVVYRPVSGVTHQLNGTLPNLNTSNPGIPSGWVNPSTGLPYQLTFGWTASTGGSNEYHEVNTLSSTTLNGALPLLQMTDADTSAGVLRQGVAGSFVLTPALATTGAGGADEAQPITVTDTFSTGIVPGTPTGTSWNCSASSGQTVSCTFTGGTVTAGSAYPSISVPVSVTGAATKGAGSDAARVSSIDALPVTSADSYSVEKLPSEPSITSAVPHDNSGDGDLVGPLRQRR